MKITSSDPNFSPYYIRLAENFKGPEDMFRIGVNVEQPALSKTLGGAAMIAAGGVLNLVGRLKDSQWTSRVGAVTAATGVALMTKGIDGLIVGDTLQRGASEIFLGRAMGTVQLHPEAVDTVHIS